MKFFYLFPLLLISPTVFSSDIGTFQVRIVTDRGANFSINLNNYLQGWTCTSGNSLKYQELLPDYKGDAKFSSRSVKGAGGFSIFDSGEVNMTVNKDMSSQSRIKARVSETCQRLREEDDPNSPNGKRTVQDIKTFGWDCEFNSFPTTVGSTQTTLCAPDKDLFTTSFDFSTFLNLLKNTSFKAEITLLSRQEKFLADLCPQGRLHNRKIIKVSQGLDHFTGENDFHFSILIAGVPQEINLKQIDGVLHEEIAICTDEEVEISITAYEKDLIFNDIYNCDPGQSEKIRLSMARPGENRGYVELKRPGLLSKLFLEPSKIKFEMRSAPVEVRAPAFKK